MEKKKLKLNWTQKFSVAEDGFYGHLYLPVKDDFIGKAILVLGGGGMPYRYTQDEAEAFACIGITALAVGYFGVPDTPKTIAQVPVEYVEKAADRLHAMGVKVVIAAGISKGAELALIAASLLPQVNAVIAFSPSSRVNMGIGKGISWVNTSSWTFRDHELPFAYAPSSGWRALWHTIRARELTFRPVYENAYHYAGKDTFIPVEKIQGPVLLAASSVDSLWPSAEACGEIMARLDSNHFIWSHKQLVYPYASHILLPFDNPYGRLFRVGRRYPSECRKTIFELQCEVLNWLKCLDQ